MGKSIRRMGIILTVVALGVFSSISMAGAAVEPTGAARGATTVTLNQATIGAVVNLGLTPAAVSPGVLGMDGTALKAAFPITGNVLKGGLIKHVGGLSLSTPTTMLTLTNYTIDTNKGVLTAMAAVNGTTVGRIPLFNLGSAPSQTGCAANASLSLTSEAATALNAIFGAPLTLTGANFGVACVAPR